MSVWKPVVILLLAGVFVWFARAWMHSPEGLNKPIRYVKIEGAFQYTGKDQLKQLLAAEMKKGFYHADVDHIRHLLVDLPLVAYAYVDRVWPDAVYIKIIEQKPIVRWGDKAVLNKDGELLLPDNIDEFKQLPLITGPEGQEKKLLEIMKGVYIVLMDKSMQLAEFHVNERRAWRIKLVNGLEMLLGRKAPLENMQRFLKTMDLLGEEQLAKIASVDTRYPNGYALSWKVGAPATDWKAVAKTY